VTKIVRKRLMEAILHQRTGRQESDSDKLEWREEVPTDEACAPQFVGEQSRLIITAVPHLDENI
jgi:hypothetical protein